MTEVASRIKNLTGEIKGKATLIAISKTISVSQILEAYSAGQRIFGENKVQEMVSKYEQLPKDIEWHLVGHLQSNKVKYIAPFVSLIHSVDSLRLLQEINKQAKKNNRIINFLLQIHIAQEETKFGLDLNEAENLINSSEFRTLTHVKLRGLMGMATNTKDELQVRKEFQSLKAFFEQIRSEFSDFNILSMGMSSDYKIAIEEGSTHVRIGSLIFGERNY